MKPELCIRGERRSAEVTRLVGCARGYAARVAEKRAESLNRALRALSKDLSTAHVADSLARLSSAEPNDLVAEAATALSPVGARVKSLSIQRGSIAGCASAERPAIRVTL